jgi:dTDP-4-amino-4,6-dideoxygalactose transaminase
MIPVTKPFLPKLEEYQILLEQIWQRQWLTNNGPLVNKLELDLKKYLNVNHLLYLSNGTVALQIAIKALDLQGEIITTPFSYVATTSSIVWEGATPIFVDIDKDTLNINPELIEAAITDKTSAILATHVFGNACEIHKINAIAKKHNLKVIYDAAHCFGTKYENKSIFEFGDVSTTSFHATKLFHTIEGGAVFTKHSDILKKMSYMRNFGHDGPEAFQGLGINGKNSEFHAAMGLVNLNHIDEILKNRKAISESYTHYLGKNKNIQFQKITDGVSYNYAYYPIILNDELTVLKLIRELNANLIYPRRYFFPSLNTLPYLKSKENPNSEDISRRILCLPLYNELTFDEVQIISRIILRVLNN